MLSTKPLPLPKTLPMRRSTIILLAALLALALLLAILYKPLLALYHQEQGGRMLAEVLPAGDNAYGGFACLRPFLEDLQQRAKVQRALEHLTKAQSLAPRQAHTYYQIGRAYCLLGDYERAVPAFQTFAELRPKNPLASLELAFALLNACPPNGKCADGLNSYDVWRRAGVTAEHFLEMAERERQKENYPEALLYYQQAQRMGRELRSTIAYVRYLIFKANGDDERALQALQSAVEMDMGWVNEEIMIQSYLLGSKLSKGGQTRKAENIIRAFGNEPPRLIQIGEEFQKEGMYTLAMRLYQAAGVGRKIDFFDPFLDLSSLIVLESFVSTNRWLPCPWCENVEGRFEVSTGILEVSYSNNLAYRDGFGYLFIPNLFIGNHKELLLRLKGEPGALLTMEIVVDGERSRPLNYQPLPQDWEIWAVPIQGDVLNEILIGIGELEPVLTPLEYHLFIDWIALR